MIVEVIKIQRNEGWVRISVGKRGKGKPTCTIGWMNHAPRTPEDVIQNLDEVVTRIAELFKLELIRDEQRTWHEGHWS